MSVFSGSLSWFTATPSTNTVPLSGDKRQPNIDKSVVFPLPEGPMTKVSVPRSNVSEMSRSAGTLASPLPKETLAPSTPKKWLGTEHSPRLDREGATNGSNRCECAHEQGGDDHGRRQPPRCVNPRNQRFCVINARNDH